MICSGGQDLCLWDRNGRLLSKYDRQNLEENSRNSCSCLYPYQEYYTSYTLAILIIVPLMFTTGSIHSVLKLDSRHFGVVAASDYKSLGIDSLLIQ